MPGQTCTYKVNEPTIIAHEPIECERSKARLDLGKRRAGVEAAGQLPSRPNHVNQSEVVALCGPPNGAKLVVCSGMNDSTGLDLAFANVYVLVLERTLAEPRSQVSPSAVTAQGAHMLARQDTSVPSVWILYSLSGGRHSCVAKGAARLWLTGTAGRDGEAKHNNG